MVKKLLLGGIVSHMLDELSPDIPEGKEPQIENEVTHKLQSILGENWALLPVTGGYMMILVLVLNYALLPLGITPVRIADKAISKSRELELDDKFSELLNSAKSTAKSSGEFTIEKLKELNSHTEGKGKLVEENLKELFDKGKGVGFSVFSRGKKIGSSVLGSLKTKFQDGEEE